MTMPAQKVVPIIGTLKQGKFETRHVTIAEANSWRLPYFQRGLELNKRKVKELIERLKETGNGAILRGIILLGFLESEPNEIYLIDGSHRRAAFEQAGLSSVIANLWIRSYATMAEMADDFVVHNANLVRQRPDDLLRAKCKDVPVLRRLTTQFSFVGFDHINQNEYAPIVSASMLLRAWGGSASETPHPRAAGNALEFAESLDDGEVENLARFVDIAFAAWGRERENLRLWTQLNLSMCMWLWRRLVIDRARPASRRSVVLTPEEFKKCLMSISASRDYIDWLVGRRINERDRSPCYARLKAIFSKRLIEEGRPKPSFPQPEWFHSRGG